MDNYSKPTWDLVRLHFVYPWFKTWHFVHLYFNLLPPPPRLRTSPLDVRKTHFYSKLEHNMDQITRTHSLFLMSPWNAKIPYTELGFWFFWLCFCVRVRFWLWVVLRQWKFEDKSAPGTTFLLYGSELGFHVLMVALIHKKLIIDVFFEWKLLRFKWAYVYIWDLCAENKSNNG